MEDSPIATEMSSLQRSVHGHELLTRAPGGFYPMTENNTRI
jgi:hypothetical protein